MNKPKPTSQHRNLIFYSDPGHGWLKVPVEDLRTLDLCHEISVYSYMTPDAAYLEEDRDLGVFKKAAEDAGWTLTIKPQYSERSRIREYSSFSATWAVAGMVFGSRWLARDGFGYTIEGREGRHLILKRDDGAQFGCNMTHVVRFLCTPSVDVAAESELMAAAPKTDNANIDRVAPSTLRPGFSR